ncbi:response regulator [Oscillatoria sp. FACHB-1407]|uniref:response regulator n=1 Tax=Oscillatoria sp. FACHB-1407 TaxID=2692847 RepID=UPI001688719A|nr:response regulator [Oscillatoria sp. FACHB-1407]MBD2460590.1 response regulator [Oscillatoria sp. FACHB-1407]
MEERTASRTILIIESDANHAQVLQTALQNEEMPQRIVVQNNVVQATHYLSQAEENTTVARPDLILLNLKEFENEGKQFITEIKTNPKLKRIPLIILTTSADQADIFQCYALQSNCYVIKSDDTQELLAIAKKIKDFWLEIVTLPME